MEENSTASVMSGLKNKPERKLLYIRYLRLILALGYVSLVLGFLAFAMVSMDLKLIILGAYGPAVSVFAMAIVGLVWVTGEPAAASSEREWQYQFLVIVGLLLIGTLLMSIGTVVLALPYAIVMYLYLARYIRGPK